MGTQAAVVKAAELCRAEEGFRSKPYLCPAGVPTIGYGSTRYPDGRRVQLTDPPCTKEQAEEWLQHELSLCAIDAIKASPVLLKYESALAAVVDFIYNLGIGRYRSSTFKRRVDALDWAGAAVECKKWVRGGGKILPGLVRRRGVEAGWLLACLSSRE